VGKKIGNFFPPKIGLFFSQKKFNMEMEYSLLSVYFLFWRNFVSNKNDGAMYNLRFFSFFFFLFLAKFGTPAEFSFQTGHKSELFI
jgi:hypothetical protein